MIYTMPGMQSQLHAVLNKPGTYSGMSANYSGAGFSDMRFTLKGVDEAGFAAWAAGAKASGRPLDLATYQKLEKPSEKVPPMRFAAVDPDLFRRILERCVAPGTPCMSDVMAHDRHAGGDPNEMRPGAGMPATHSSMPAEGRPEPSGARVPKAGGQTKPQTPNMTQHPKTPAPADNTEKY
jgi:cytochrome o ubiquinol oxidase subunit 2